MYSRLARAALTAFLFASGIGTAVAASVPPWMRAVASAPLPPHDGRTSAVLLYSETTVTVEANGKLRQLERRVFRILRQEGADRGIARVDFDARTRVLRLHAWCIPAEGKEFDVGDREAVISSIVGAANGQLVNDVRSEILRVPAAVAGSVVGFEMEKELQPYVLADEWTFQDTIPVREARYALELPPGWQYKATWINHPDVAGASAGPNRWQWTVDDLAPIPIERQMPPWRGIAGRLMISLVPPGGKNAGFQSWPQMSQWYLDLTRGRQEPSPQIKQKVAELTSGAGDVLGRMRALASFVQEDIRYVAIELGIGGLQPHAAADVFSNRYGDCKDKATLLAAMLREIGVESYYVIVDSERGAVTRTTPANLAFDHVILAIVLPPDLADGSLLAVAPVTPIGRLLFFDPTDPFTPLGGLPGQLQGGYGLLVAPAGGELVQLPTLPEDATGVDRTAQLTLEASGTLSGEVHEVWRGDRAAIQRGELDSAGTVSDRIKRVESRLAESLSNFQITKAVVRNRNQNPLPIDWTYSFAAEHYAKASGDLLIVRPRVIGTRSSSLLETDEPRRHPIEFEAPERDTDEFDIALPQGFVPDDLPPPVDADYGFAAYHSRTELVGTTLRYRRTFEVRSLSVPVDRAEDLRKLYRIIYGDERVVAVLERKGS